MEQIKDPHDRFFKYSFSRPNVALNFVQTYGPKEIADLVVAESMRLSKDSFVDERLEERFSDLVYEAELRGKGKIFIYFLFEHKSYQDPEVGLYLLQLMARIWLNYRRQEKGGLLPPILPMVVYHGETKWRGSPCFQDMVSLSGVMRPYVPGFEYLIWDLSQYTDDEIKGDVLLRVSLLLMKHIFSKEIGKTLPWMLRLLEAVQDKQSALQFLHAALRYLSSGGRHVGRQELVDALKQIYMDGGGDFMATLAEQWMEEGMVKDAREMVQEAVSARFGPVPEDIVEEIGRFDNRDILKLLHRQAIACSDLTGFRKALQEARN